MSNLLETQEGRAVLAWACEFVDGPEANHCRRWTTDEYEACEAVENTDKLAEIGQRELARLNVTCANEPYVADPKRAAIEYDGNGKRMYRRVRLFIGESTSYLSVDVIVFRRKLAAWLRLSDGDRDAAERILRKG